MRYLRCENDGDYAISSSGGDSIRKQDAHGHNLYRGRSPHQVQIVNNGRLASAVVISTAMIW